MSKEHSLSDDVFSAIGNVTRQWKSEKRKADRHDRIRSYRRFYIPSDRITLREVAFEVMEQAYNKASANGKYYANARQIFYAARPLILAKATKESLDSRYFTQVLLKDYLELHSPAWKVVWDARGHFHEPHTGKEFGVGGIEVIDYAQSWRDPAGACGFDYPSITSKLDTKGPHGRYSAVLFIEKEGFDQILEDTRFGERYDLAIMSTKGIPVKAACDLLNKLQQHIKIFVLHDFDKTGFTIVKTLMEGTRMAQGSEVMDLGFRWADIQGLDSEPVQERGGRYGVEYYLRHSGLDLLTEEINFLTSGQRVELNAMMSDQFIAWLDGKLRQQGIKKIEPDKELLEATYRRAIFAARVDEALEKLREKMDSESEETEIPKGLIGRLRRELKKNPEFPWDQVVWNLANEDYGSEPTEDEEPEDPPPRPQPTRPPPVEASSDKPKPGKSANEKSGGWRGVNGRPSKTRRS